MLPPSAPAVHHVILLLQCDASFQGWSFHTSQHECKQHKRLPGRRTNACSRTWQHACWLPEAGPLLGHPSQAPLL